MSPMSAFIRAVDRHHPPSVVQPSACAPIDVLRIAFEASPHGQIVSDKDGAIMFANVKASAIFDYPPDALNGQPLSRLLPDMVPAPHDAFWTHAHGAASLAGRSIAGRRRDGVTVPLEIDLRMFDDGVTQYVVAAIVETTERLNLEARLAAATNSHLGFQRLIADVAARFGAVEPDGVDDAVADGLREIGEALQLDCVMLWRGRSGEAIVPTLPQHAQSSCPVSEPFPPASIPFVVASLKASQTCSFATLDDLPDSDRDAFRRRGFQSGAVVPLASAGKRRTRAERPRAGLDDAAAGVDAGHPRTSASDRRRDEPGLCAPGQLQRPTEGARRGAAAARTRGGGENVELRREVKGLRTSRPIASESAVMRDVLAQIAQVAPTPATVLLTGETGTGKEVMAQAIHDLSPRHQRQMIRVSCAAIPTSLIESELFGREKGAYTGALSRQIGRFEAANQSTLFSTRSVTCRWKSRSSCSACSRSA